MVHTPAASGAVFPDPVDLGLKCCDLLFDNECSEHVAEHPGGRCSRSGRGGGVVECFASGDRQKDVGGFVLAVDQIAQVGGCGCISDDVLC